MACLKSVLVKWQRNILFTESLLPKTHIFFIFFYHTVIEMRKPSICKLSTIKEVEGFLVRDIEIKILITAGKTSPQCSSFA